MAKICVERPHNLDKEHLHLLGQKLADKLTQKLGGECQWKGEELYYNQSGAKAHVQLEPTMIRVNVELGLLMAAFTGMVESEVNRVLDEQLA